MINYGKWYLFGTFLIGAAGALAHDVFSFSKVAVVTGFMIFGAGVLLSLYLSGRA